MPLKPAAVKARTEVPVIFISLERSARVRRGPPAPVFSIDLALPLQLRLPGWARGRREGPVPAAALLRICYSSGARSPSMWPRPGLAPAGRGGTEEPWSAPLLWRACGVLERRMRRAHGTPLAAASRQAPEGGPDRFSLAMQAWSLAPAVLPGAPLSFVGILHFCDGIPGAEQLRRSRLGAMASRAGRRLLSSRRGRFRSTATVVAR